MADGGGAGAASTAGTPVKQTTIPVRIRYNPKIQPKDWWLQPKDCWIQPKNWWIQPKEWFSKRQNPNL